MISAKMITDSLSPQGKRLSTLEVIMPRYILAEFNTHRMLSKNSASSRAIPFRKMVKSVLENPFIPYAFQKDHSGMQGTEYLDSNNKEYGLSEFIAVLITTLNKYDKDSDEFKKLSKEIDEKIEIIDSLLTEYKYQKKTLKDWWLLAKDKAVECASILYVFRVTKQLANRLLEPFMYHKVLVSGTEFSNFFNLRCPQYRYISDITEQKTLMKSKKDWINKALKEEPNKYNELLRRINQDGEVLTWLSINEGQADIHMMFLAEAIYDAMNESKPRQLKEGEWHIPYGDDFDGLELNRIASKISDGKLDFNTAIEEAKCRISIARCARLSYQTLGDNPVIDYEADLKLYEVLTSNGHASPTEHVARAMTDEEYNSYVKGKVVNQGTDLMPMWILSNEAKGWCRNFQGFIMFRELLD